MKGYQVFPGRPMNLVMTWRQEGEGAESLSAVGLRSLLLLRFSVLANDRRTGQIEQLPSAFKRRLGRQTGRTWQFNREAVHLQIVQPSRYLSIGHVKQKAHCVLELLGIESYSDSVILVYQRQSTKLVAFLSVDRAR
jgi:hypothetical protein